MIFTPSVRKFVLTAHVISSVGWLGAVAGFLVLAISGIRSQNLETIRSAYLGMDAVAWFVIVPFSLASPVTGVLQSLGTTWGLFRHYWVLVKLLITVLATAILLLHLRPISYMADVTGTRLVGSNLRSVKMQLVANAIAALVVLMVATVLSIYKPAGLTRYGQRKLSYR